MEQYSWDELNYTLTGIEQTRNKGGRKLGYALAKNARIIRKEMEAIEETFPELPEEQQEELETLQERQRKLIQKYADKPIPPTGVQNIMSLFESDLSQKAYFQAYESLEKEYPDLMVAQKHREKAIQEIKQDRLAEVDFYTFPFDWIPDEWGMQFLDPLFPLIDEETFEAAKNTPEPEPELEPENVKHTE